MKAIRSATIISIAARVLRPTYKILWKKDLLNYQQYKVKHSEEKCVINK